MGFEGLGGGGERGETKEQSEIRNHGNHQVPETGRCAKVLEKTELLPPGLAPGYTRRVKDKVDEEVVDSSLSSFSSRSVSMVGFRHPAANPVRHVQVHPLAAAAVRPRARAALQARDGSWRGCVADRQKTASGLFLPSSATSSPLPEATVIAVGPGAAGKDGVVVPVAVKEGDRVLLPSWGGSPIKVGEEVRGVGVVLTAGVPAVQGL